MSCQMYFMKSSKAMQQRMSRRLAVVKPVAVNNPQLHRTPRQFAAATLAALQIVVSLPSHAAWDGSSAALGSCALGEAGDNCRKAVLAKDQLGSYSSAVSNETKLGTKATNVPVASLGGPYAQETSDLAALITQYVDGDVYDEGRPALVKKLKSEGQAWVSKYARGGSARTLSARKFYIAIDAVQGHLASNGFAPFPRNKASKVASDVASALSLIAEGK